MKAQLGKGFTAKQVHAELESKEEDEITGYAG